MGMVVDSASQVVRIPADQIDPPPPVLGGFSQEFITGVGKLDDKLIILLNTDAVLTADEKRHALGSLDGCRGRAGTALGTAIPPRHRRRIGAADGNSACRTEAVHHSWRPRPRAGAGRSAGAQRPARAGAAHHDAPDLCRPATGRGRASSRCTETSSTPGSPVALSALEAVGALADTRSFPLLARLLAGAQEEVQCGAVRALGRIGHPDVPGSCELAKTTRSEKMRREILDALAAAAPRDKDVVGSLRQTARRHGLPRSRAHAAGLLLKIGGELALEELLPDAREEILDQVLLSAPENPALGPRAVTHCAPLYARLPARTAPRSSPWPPAQPLPNPRRSSPARSPTPTRRSGAPPTRPWARSPTTPPWSPPSSPVAEAVEANPALEDEVQQALLRVEKLPDAAAPSSPRVRAQVIARIAELYKQLGAAGPQGLQRHPRAGLAHHALQGIPGVLRRRGVQGRAPALAEGRQRRHPTVS